MNGHRSAVNPEGFGTKCAPHFILDLARGEERTVKLRLSIEQDSPADAFGNGFDEVFRLRIRDANEFHSSIDKTPLSPRLRRSPTGAGWFALEQAVLSLCCPRLAERRSVADISSAERYSGRNSTWSHFHAHDLLSMPDKWEYPWFAAWDLAFHMIPMAELDADFAKHQLRLLLREWYMHPSGQLAAYEFAFHDVNPPVHAWSAWRVYKMTGKAGQRDRQFLESVFQKLLLNFTWWVNRKDADGKNLFQGGFLGLDNIGVFDRSRPLPTGGYLLQSDGTAWMAFYSLTMLAMALELAVDNPVYEDLASKFLEHYVSIAEAINNAGGTGLWDEADGFYYDKLVLEDGQKVPLRTRSLVGLVPLVAVEVFEEDKLQALPGFYKRMQWFIEHRPELARHITFSQLCPEHKHRILAIPSRERLERLLNRLLDESEFLAKHGIRSLSRVHLERPFVFQTRDSEHRVGYVPGEGNTYLFGGNSNWRGPVWFPINYLIIEALERYDHFYGPDFKVEFPQGSGLKLTLKEVSVELSRMHASLFLADVQGAAPAMVNPCFMQQKNTGAI